MADIIYIRHSNHIDTANLESQKVYFVLSYVKASTKQAGKYGVLLVNASLNLFKLTMKLQFQNKQ